jgi:hypothetical protein
LAVLLGLGLDALTVFFAQALGIAHLHAHARVA